MRATPKIFLPDRFRAADFPPELRDHPRFGEWLAHVKMQRSPKPFQEWLAHIQQQEAGKSIAGVNLQRLMDDEKFCRVPLKIRRHK